MTRPSPEPHASTDEPNTPFYKDERVLKFITGRGIMIIILTALIVFVGLTTYGIITIANVANSNQSQTQSIETQQDQIQKLLAKIQELQDKRHDERVADQQRTDDEIRNLVCYVLSFQKTENPVSKQLRKEYHCPALGKKFVPVPISTPGSSTPPDIPNNTNPAPQPAPRPSPTKTRSTTTPIATVTPTRTPPATKSNPIPIPTLTLPPLPIPMPCPTALGIPVVC